MVACTLVTIAISKVIYKYFECPIYSTFAVNLCSSKYLSWISREYIQKAIVISGCWPGKGKGYEIACNATLNFYSKYYDEIIYFGPRDEFKDSEYTNSFTNVTFIDSKFDRTSIAFRFFRSLFSSYPAICVRF